jgi:hypothetical protein
MMETKWQNLPAGGFCLTARATLIGLTGFEQESTATAPGQRLFVKKH